MKITMESTDQFVALEIGGAAVPARVWEGITESGVPCLAFIVRMVTHRDDDNAEFERDLVEHAAGTADPLRLLLD